MKEYRNVDPLTDSFAGVPVGEALKIIKSYPELIEFVEFMALDHDVDTSTKHRSDYWANQFLLARRKAKALLEELK